MKKFLEYVEKKEVDKLNSKIAEIFVHTNINPWNYLIEMYSEDDRIVSILSEKKEIIEEGLFGNIGRAVRGAAGTIGNWLGQTAVSGANTAMAAGRQIRAEIRGPEARYRNALEALNALSKELERNQKVQDAAKSDPKYRNLIGQLNGILKQLSQQKDDVTNLLKTSVDHATATGASTRMGT